MSPRTFSRYFATKEAVCLALVDAAVDMAAEFRPHAVNVEVARRMGVELTDRGLRLVGAV
jgi:AcrR family transcriptional regulator